MLQMVKGSLGSGLALDDDDEDEDEDHNLHLADVCPERQIFGRKETSDTSVSLYMHLIRSSNHVHHHHHSLQDDP